MVLICEYLFKSYSLYQLPKSTVELRVEQVDFNYNITTSFKVPNQSVCQPVEPPTSATMPVETCLGKDASVVCSASMNSTPSYYQRCNYADPFTCLCPSHAHMSKIILKFKSKMCPQTGRKVGRKLKHKYIC